MTKLKVRDLRIGRRDGWNQVAGTVIWEDDKERAQVDFFIELEGKYKATPEDVRAENLSSTITNFLSIIGQIMGEARSAFVLGPLTPPRSAKAGTESEAD
ncbi:MAG TPA: hypothetical protein ENK53_06915 [Thiotrichales bacterium]|nr:hypothetical protein [Thiotrichales bacterium]